LLWSAHCQPDMLMTEQLLLRGSQNGRGLISGCKL